MAPHNSFERQPAPLERAVLLDGLERVLRAGGNEAAAGGTQGRDAFPVKAHEREKKSLHGFFSRSPSFPHTFKNARSSSRYSAPTARVRATIPADNAKLLAAYDAYVTALKGVASIDYGDISQERIDALVQAGSDMEPLIP